MAIVSIFNGLVLISILAFVIFGSLSHLSNLAIVTIMFIYFLNGKKNHTSNKNPIILYILISSIFFLFFIRGLAYQDILDLLISLSPMLPIPIIGIMILLNKDEVFKISSKNLAFYAKISVFCAFVIILVFRYYLADILGFQQYFHGKLHMFSGNPIPFSTVLFGVTILCLSNLEKEPTRDKVLSVFCCLIGFWLAGILSGSRGTLLAIIISAPCLLLFISRSILISLVILLMACIFGWVASHSNLKVLESNLIVRINNGIETLLKGETSDSSMNKRMQMWSASITTIEEKPLHGHGISNRFTAIQTHLPKTFAKTYSHPHNDIMASIIGAGVIGGLLSLITLLAPIWASLLSGEDVAKKLLFGTLLTFSFLITGNFNTMLFNDITASWLAFSTFLIWTVRFSDNINTNNLSRVD